MGKENISPEGHETPLPDKYKEANMEKRTIYISNDPPARDEAIENAMIRIAEETDTQILIEDLKKSSSNSPNGPLVVLCSGVDMENRNVLDSIARRYFNNQHVILYKPTNREINIIYRYIEGRNYFSAETATSSYSLFGLKRGEDGIRYILENHDKLPDLVSESLVDFLEGKQEMLAKHHQKDFTKAAQNVLNEKINLAEMARHYVTTKQFSLAGKHFSLSYYMVSCHAYDENSESNGEDWFFIQQYGILNGAGGYDKHWAGARVDVNGESWYVGEGEVALNYVDYYEMTNKIKSQSGSVDSDIVLLYAEPQAFNGVTTYTISESQSISGTIGFEGGKDGGESVLKGSGSISAGASFDSSYTFEVADCSCEGTSLGDGTASAGWKYSFKRAQQNRAAGKWQRLHDPAKLSTSVFSPLNTWIWKFPTDKRDDYKLFHSKFSVGIMNTISRYSGSQSPKHINGKSSASTEFDVTLHMPPLLGVSTRNLRFSQKCSTQVLTIASQGPWTLKLKDSNDTWVSMNKSSGSGESTEVSITVEKLPDNKTRDAILQLRQEPDGSAGGECIEIGVTQSQNIRG